MEEDNAAQAGPSKIASHSKHDVDGPQPSRSPPSHADDGEGFEEPEFDPDADDLAGPAGGPSSPSLDTADFPLSHELVLKDHTKVVSALALDPSGARIISGSHDYDCKL